MCGEDPIVHHVSCRVSPWIDPPEHLDGPGKAQWSQVLSSGLAWGLVPSVLQEDIQHCLSQAPERTPQPARRLLLSVDLRCISHVILVIVLGL